jgi:hypothetical protein
VKSNKQKIVRRRAPEVIPGYWEEQKRVGRILNKFVRALQTGDRKALRDSIEDIDERILDGWKQVFRRIARIKKVDPDIRDAFLGIWISLGDHLRQEVGDDCLLAQGLRLLLPPYDGEQQVLYRGEGAANHQSRTYGLAWTAKRAVAEDYAEKRDYRRTEGGNPTDRRSAGRRRGGRWCAGHGAAGAQVRGPMSKDNADTGLPSMRLLRLRVNRLPILTPYRRPILTPLSDGI